MMWKELVSQMKYTERGGGVLGMKNSPGRLAAFSALKTSMAVAPAALSHVLTSLSGLDVDMLISEE